MQDFKGFLVLGQGHPSLANDKSSSLRQFYTNYQLTTRQRLALPISRLSNENKVEKKKKGWGRTEGKDKGWEDGWMCGRIGREGDNVA